MAYDIHGNDLQPGHCEVHPWVHQSYPCSICYSDQNKERRRRDTEQCAQTNLPIDGLTIVERHCKHIRELQEIIDTLENDNGAIPEWLWKRIEAVKTPMTNGSHG
jgi:hypothetical protein